MDFKNNRNAENSIIYESDKLYNINSESIENIINIDDIINFISSKLYSIIHTNKSMKKKQSKGLNEPLYSKNIPALSLNKYLIRIFKYTECENNTLITAYLHIIKLIQKENFVLGINNVYRLLLGAVVISKKFLEDIRFDNSYYCGIGGISNNDLNLIEYSLFIRLDFNLNFKNEDIDKIYTQIFKTLPKSRLNEIVNKTNINNNINNIIYCNIFYNVNCKNISNKDNKSIINNKFEDIKVKSPKKYKRKGE